MLARATALSRRPLAKHERGAGGNCARRPGGGRQVPRGRLTKRRRSAGRAAAGHEKWARSTFVDGTQAGRWGAAVSPLAFGEERHDQRRDAASVALRTADRTVTTGEKTAMPSRGETPGRGANKRSTTWGPGSGDGGRGGCPTRRAGRALVPARAGRASRCGSARARTPRTCRPAMGRRVARTPLAREPGRSSAAPPPGRARASMCHECGDT